ncbi:MAG: SDR family oxidoreductase [Cyclobacteriaceae bacterium]|nr:SDR family oxidoreductase [Cyclobacteriaceae bacterium]
MKGKNCIVTGGNSGIGFETALALAKLGANVVILSRNQDKAEAAVKSIKAKSQNNQVDYILCDLSSQMSIKDAAKYISRDFDQIDVLVNNAGTWFSKLELTEDGIERQFAVNHIAYFLLTHELLSLLAKSDDARVICVSSDSHFHGKIHFEDLTLGKKYHGLKAYAQSKLANVLFVYEFDRMLKKQSISNISINAVQPGLVKTDIGLKHTISLHGLAWRVRRLGGVSPAKGAETSIYLASSMGAKGESGQYWDKSKPKPSSKKSYDTEGATRLWQICKELCAIDDYFRPLHIKQGSA